MEPYQTQKANNEIKMQFIDNYVTKYEFSIKRKILLNEGVALSVNVNNRLLKPEEKENETVAGVELQVHINLSNKDQEDLGKIDTNICGFFGFEKGIGEDEMQKALKTKGASVVYDQLRTFINACTALSNSLPHINLPLLNFEVNKS